MATEAWEHIVQAVLAAALGDQDEARQYLGKADRLTPLHDAAFWVVCNSDLDDEWVKDTRPYLELEARYASLYENYQRTLAGLLSHHGEQVEHYNNQLAYVETEYQPR